MLTSSSSSITIRIISITISLFCLCTRRHRSFPPAHILTTARNAMIRKGRKKSAKKAVRKTKKSHLVFLWWYQQNKFFTFYETVTNSVKYNCPLKRISWRRLYFSRIFRFFFFLYIRHIVPCWTLRGICASLRFSWRLFWTAAAASFLPNSLKVLWPSHCSWLRKQDPLHNYWKQDEGRP